MAKGDPRKPKGKMSAYAFFVQTCRDEHKKKNPDVPVNFSEFSKKCSGRWKVREAAPIHTHRACFYSYTQPAPIHTHTHT